MVEEAMDLGFQYFGISDHSKSSAYAGGLDADRLLDQVEQIRTLEKPWGDLGFLQGRK